LADLPNKKYKVIYADPPWLFRTRSDKGKDKSPEKHYECMSLNDICNLPVKEIADENCVLLMWVCDSMIYLELAFWLGLVYTIPILMLWKMNDETPR
jgi:N6-adenosine-specific RNA methylase IME4